MNELCQSVLSWTEFAYYIAFIILTILIVRYTKKTYELEASRRYELLCKITIPNSNVEHFEFPYSLEIYNEGNKTARNVQIWIDGSKLTTIDFVKPGSFELYPIGTMGCMISGNISEGGMVKVTEGQNLNVMLRLDDKDLHYSIKTDILFATRPHDTMNKQIVQSLDNIATKIERLKKGY